MYVLCLPTKVASRANRLNRWGEGEGFNAFLTSESLNFGTGKQET